MANAGKGARGPVLDPRALNRAFLARQLLLTRAELTPWAAVRHLVGLQAQAPQAPYVALWTRLRDFTTAGLGELLTSRQVVRIAVMRGTIHLITADDCRYLRPLVQPVHLRGFQGNWGKNIPDVDLDQLAAQARTLLEARPMTFAELGAELVTHWPGRDAASLAQAARTMLALVQPPPRGVWGASGAARHTTAESWLGQPLVVDPAPDDMVLRYLAAFGPATVLDVQAWSGLTRLGAVIERLRPRLVTFRDDKGRELFDLPDAPRPDPDISVPVRYLAEFDNALLSHADRSRIMGEAERGAVMTVNGQVSGTILVDGFVRATWRLDTAKPTKTTTLTVTTLGRSLSKKDVTAVTAEGRRLLDFAARDGAEARIVIS